MAESRNFQELGVHDLKDTRRVDANLLALESQEQRLKRLRVGAVVGVPGVAHSPPAADPPSAASAAGVTPAVPRPRSFSLSGCNSSPSRRASHQSPFAAQLDGTYVDGVGWFQRPHHRHKREGASPTRLGHLGAHEHAVVVIVLLRPLPRGHPPLLLYELYLARRIATLPEHRPNHFAEVMPRGKAWRVVLPAS